MSKDEQIDQNKQDTASDPVLLRERVRQIEVLLGRYKRMAEADHYRRLKAEEDAKMDSYLSGHSSRPSIR